MQESGKKLLKFLEKPDAYPHDPEYVEHVQTHISHVFIAPPFVYKVKKPVDFGFLDYSTLKKRKYFCEQEVALNRRLCSGIYLGVVAIEEMDGSFALETEEMGEAVEYAVKMKKLEERFFLHTYIENDTLAKEHLDRVSDKLAEFYLGQDPSADVLKYGEIQQIRYNTDENFQQTERFIGETIDEASYEGITYFTDRYFDRRATLFKRRIQQKRIVDGHGDLHLEHIHVQPDGICIYDCIEFNERFRYGDQAADLAFLAMDLDFLDRWKEERYFLDLMAQKLEDPDLHEIIDFYKCYRAYVKGKVKSLQSGEEEVEAEDRKKARKKAISYFGLALRYALLGSRPRVLIFMGRVGTGKSTLAEHLSETLGMDVYSSDRIRKRLAGQPLKERTPASKREELYAPEMSERTYDELYKWMRNYSEQGKSIILDATFNTRKARRDLVEHVKRSNSNYLFIEARATDETVKARLREREKKEGVISDARLEDYFMLDKRYKEPDEIGAPNFVDIHTNTPLNETLKQLYKKMVELQFE